MNENTVTMRLKNLYESLGNTPLKEVIRDIWLDADDLEKELAYQSDRVRELEIELAWREHDEPTSDDKEWSGGCEEGSVPDDEPSKQSDRNPYDQNSTEVY